ncbi:MAG: hypothetical protein U1E86_08030 [Burkholderiaceae bacterium]
MDGVLTVVKGLLEVAGYFLLAQGAVWLLCVGRPGANPVYRLLQLLTSPVTRVARALSPSFVPDRHVPLVAFGIVFWLWVGAILARRALIASAMA